MRTAIFRIPIEMIQGNFRIPGVAVFYNVETEMEVLEVHVESAIFQNVEDIGQPIYEVKQDGSISWMQVSEDFCDLSIQPEDSDQYVPKLETQTPGPKGLEVPCPATQPQTPSPKSDPAKEAGSQLDYVVPSATDTVG